MKYLIDSKTVCLSTFQNLRFLIFTCAKELNQLIFFVLFWVFFLHKFPYFYLSMKSQDFCQLCAKLTSLYWPATYLPKEVTQTLPRHSQSPPIHAAETTDLKRGNYTFSMLRKGKKPTFLNWAAPQSSWAIYICSPLSLIAGRERGSCAATRHWSSSFPKRG